MTVRPKGRTPIATHQAAEMASHPPVGDELSLTPKAHTKPGGASSRGIMFRGYVRRCLASLKKDCSLTPNASEMCHKVTTVGFR